VLLDAAIDIFKTHVFRAHLTLLIWLSEVSYLQEDRMTLVIFVRNLMVLVLLPPKRKPETPPKTCSDSSYDRIYVPHYAPIIQRQTRHIL